MYLDACCSSRKRTVSVRRSEEDTKMFGVPLEAIGIVGFILVAAFAMYRADQKRKNESSD